jgi:hypothetical protein
MTTAEITALRAEYSRRAHAAKAAGDHAAAQAWFAAADLLTDAEVASITAAYARGQRRRARAARRAAAV